MFGIPRFFENVSLSLIQPLILNQILSPSTGEEEPPDNPSKVSTGEFNYKAFNMDREKEGITSSEIFKHHTTEITNLLVKVGEEKEHILSPKAQQAIAKVSVQQPVRFTNFVMALMPYADIDSVCANAIDLKSKKDSAVRLSKDEDARILAEIKEANLTPWIKRLPNELPVDFIKRVYVKWCGHGLKRAMLKSLDPTLHAELSNKEKIRSREIFPIDAKSGQKTRFLSEDEAILTIRKTLLSRIVMRKKRLKSKT